MGFEVHCDPFRKGVSGISDSGQYQALTFAVSFENLPGHAFNRPRHAGVVKDECACSHDLKLVVLG
jgi:hypothetical protein